jgi:hypothetical protein
MGFNYIEQMQMLGMLAAVYRIFIIANCKSNWLVVVSPKYARALLVGPNKSRIVEMRLSVYASP